MVERGDKVKDRVSGFVGIAVCETKYLQGCTRFGVQAIVKNNEPPKNWEYFDVTQLKVILKRVVKIEQMKNPDDDPGGYQPDNAQKKF